MRRRAAPPDPDVVHALRELDAALSGEPGADPDLTEFVADVRAKRREPGPRLLATLDARVHAGFPKEGDDERRYGRKMRLVLPGLVLAATAAVVAIMVALPG